VTNYRAGDLGSQLHETRHRETFRQLWLRNPTYAGADASAPDNALAEGRPPGPLRAKRAQLLLDFVRDTAAPYTRAKVVSISPPLASEELVGGHRTHTRLARHALPGCAGVLSRDAGFAFNAAHQTSRASSMHDICRHISYPGFTSRIRIYRLARRSLPFRLRRCAMPPRTGRRSDCCYPSSKQRLIAMRMSRHRLVLKPAELEAAGNMPQDVSPLALPPSDPGVWTAPARIIMGMCLPLGRLYTPPAKRIRCYYSLPRALARARDRGAIGGKKGRLQ